MSSTRPDKKVVSKKDKEKQKKHKDKDKDKHKDKHKKDKTQKPAAENTHHFHLFGVFDHQNKNKTADAAPIATTSIAQMPQPIESPTPVAPLPAINSSTLSLSRTPTPTLMPAMPTNTAGSVEDTATPHDLGELLSGAEEVSNKAHEEPKAEASSSQTKEEKVTEAIEGIKAALGQQVVGRRDEIVTSVVAELNTQTENLQIPASLLRQPPAHAPATSCWDSICCIFGRRPKTDAAEPTETTPFFKK